MSERAANTRDRVSVEAWRDDLRTNDYWKNKPTATASMLVLLDEIERLRRFTVDDPTSIYHEAERLREALVEAADRLWHFSVEEQAGRSPGWSMAKSWVFEQAREAAAAAKAVLLEVASNSEASTPADGTSGPESPPARGSGHG